MEAAVGNPPAPIGQHLQKRSVDINYSMRSPPIYGNTRHPLNRYNLRRLQRRKRHQASNPLWSQDGPAFSHDAVRSRVPGSIVTMLTNPTRSTLARFGLLSRKWGIFRTGYDGCCRNGRPGETSKHRLFVAELVRGLAYSSLSLFVAGQMRFTRRTQRVRKPRRVHTVSSSDQGLSSHVPTE